MTPMRVRQNWIDGLFDKNAVKRAYTCGIITKEEYREIISLPQRGSKLGN